MLALRANPLNFDRDFYPRIAAFPNAALAQVSRRSGAVVGRATTRDHI
jgi:hypothetical protein